MPEEKRQIDKFKEVERELQCYDDDARFKAKLGKLLKKNPGKAEGR